MNTTPLEHNECVTLADYLRLLKSTGKILAFTHIPNETYTKSWSVKRKNKSEGVCAGIPDYIIVFKDKILFLEMKRSKGGIVSTEQKEWLKILDGKGTISGISRGFDEAKKIIDSLSY